MDKYIKKVYINPNFKNDHNFSKPNVMHVNPAFSMSMQITPDAPQKSKIFVNPHFIKSNDVSECAYAASTSSTIVTSTVTKQSVPISKSRYSLVRRQQKSGENISIAKNPITTVNVNKYKLIAVKDYKKRIEVSSYRNIQKTESDKRTSMPIGSKTHSNKYKLNRYTVAPLAEVDNRTLQRSSGYVNKFKLIKPNISTKTVENKKDLTVCKRINTTIKKNCYSPKSRFKASGKLKINNIPCPLFKKYGKCLRQEHSKCEFLHDKKHVTICRKFLKGLCHDKQCFLSHDVSSNKMPTCHFYLKGVCTKHDCPYLHVKLNDSATTCSDFLKGYCEKGSSCSKRHISIKYPSIVKNKKVKISSKRIATSAVNNQHKMVSKINVNNPIEQDTSNEKRYYKESLNTSDVCEIKPSRCKIGTLPSFIQL